MEKLRILAVIAASLATSATVTAQEKLFDNWNPKECGYTDSATFTLQTPARLHHIDVWFRWQGRESSVPYRLFHDGQMIREGMLQRADCDRDPHLEGWCAARDSFDLDARPGSYTIRTERRVCQNGPSGGAGFVKVFGFAARFEGEPHGDRDRDHDHDVHRLPFDAWRVEEGGSDGRVVWVGTWRRREGNVFEGHWHNVQTGAEVSDTLRVIEAGDHVVIRRESNNGEYRGDLSGDGTHMHGSASWYGPGWFWRAEAEGHDHDRDRR